MTNETTAITNQQHEVTAIAVLRARSPATCRSRATIANR